MSTLTLARCRSHRAAQREASRWIKMQKMWDRLIYLREGFRVEPKPHEVYAVIRDGKRWAVIFTDPTL